MRWVNIPSSGPLVDGGVFLLGTPLGGFKRKTKLQPECLKVQFDFAPGRQLEADFLQRLADEKASLLRRVEEDQ